MEDERGNNERSSLILLALKRDFQTLFTWLFFSPLPSVSDTFSMKASAAMRSSNHPPWIPWIQAAISPASVHTWQKK